jgi:hypothetical protein
MLKSKIEMKVANEYKCDSCGEIKKREEIASLSTTYQPIGLISYRDGTKNLGVRHLCGICKDEFDKHFKGFFTELKKAQLKPITEERLIKSGWVGNGILNHGILEGNIRKHFDESGRWEYYQTDDGDQIYFKYMEELEEYIEIVKRYGVLSKI